VKENEQSIKNTTNMRREDTGDMERENSRAYKVHPPFLYIFILFTDALLQLPHPRT